MAAAESKNQVAKVRQWLEGCLVRKHLAVVCDGLDGKGFSMFTWWGAFAFHCAFSALWRALMTLSRILCACYYKAKVTAIAIIARRLGIMTVRTSRSIFKFLLIDCCTN